MRRYTGSIPAQYNDQYNDPYSGRAYVEPRDIDDGEQKKRKLWPVILAAFLGMILIAGITAGVLKHFADKKDDQSTEQIVSDEPGEGDEDQNKDQDTDEDEDRDNEASETPAGAYEYNGNYYKVVNEGMSWNEADAACKALGGHLVTITSSGEQAFVRTLLEQDGLLKKHYWIGATDRNTEGHWEWVTGEAFEYSNWDPGNGQDHGAQPNNNGDQDYAEIQTINNAGNNYMTWNDADETTDSGTNQEGPWYYSKPYFGYICEWDQD